jgi:AcrR family transcriptional regulator
MQVQKEDIRNAILAAAREEFLAHGYKGTCMRSVAARAGVVLSNMYNYFRNKDEILAEVLSPLMRELERVNREHNAPEYTSLDIFTSEQYQRDSIDSYLRLITRFRGELNLLLFHSHGSRFESFRDEFTDRQTREGVAFLAAMKKKYPRVNTDISPFFLHTMSSWWFSIVGEIVTHDLTDKEIEKFLADYMAFGTAGWKRLMDV